MSANASVFLLQASPLAQTNGYPPESLLVRHGSAGALERLDVPKDAAVDAAVQISAGSSAVGTGVVGNGRHRVALEIPEAWNGPIELMISAGDGSSSSETTLILRR
jgi:hypothetical protein